MKALREMNPYQVRQIIAVKAVLFAIAMLLVAIAA